jgi:hypothetical protein
MEARVGIEPTIEELQSTALPLCYRAFWGRIVPDENFKEQYEGMYFVA